MTDRIPVHPYFLRKYSDDSSIKAAKAKAKEKFLTYYLNELRGYLIEYDMSATTKSVNLLSFGGKLEPDEVEEIVKRLRSEGFDKKPSEWV